MVKDKIDSWYFGSQFPPFFEVCVHVEEFESTWEYITKVLHIEESCLYSHLDNPEEAIIEIDFLPF